MLRKYAISEDGALHAEKYYRTVTEEFNSTRPAFRWRQLTALARVTGALEFGQARLGGDPGPTHVHGDNGDLVRLKAKGTRCDLSEGLYEQSRRHQKHERQRDLCNHKPARKPALCVRASGSPLCLEGVHGRDA